MTEIQGASFLLPDFVYDQRIICFIDLIGFTRDVQAIHKRAGLLLPVEAVLRHLSKCKADLDGARATRGVKFDARMSCFSDLVVASYKDTPKATLRAVADAAFLAQVVLRAGFLPRGVISIGRLHHDGDVIFGDALIEAHEYERSHVHNPKIALSRAFFDQLRAEFARHGHLGQYADFVIAPDDEDPYVHVLGERWPFLARERMEEFFGKYANSGIEQMYEEIKGALPIRYFQARDERERSKCEWMASYVNSTIDKQKLPSKWKVPLP